MIYCANCGEGIKATSSDAVPYVHLRTGHGLCTSLPIGYFNRRSATPDRKRITIKELHELVPPAQLGMRN